MISVVTISAALLLTGVVLIGFLFFYLRKSEPHTQELAGTVLCKKCAGRIAVSHPPKLHNEFSVQCPACHSRKLYSLSDLKR